MTRHFADEANHARYWTDCLEKLGVEPLKLPTGYQNQYIAAAGMPANLMEILAITQVFEKRVVAQYSLHANSPNVPDIVRSTIETIMKDEKWHIQWIRDALKHMEDEYGADNIRDTLKRFTLADREVYQKTAQEHRERIGDLRLASK
jgi:1,2-phenylacetyl-CoA epoxidase catalytic subunit